MELAILPKMSDESDAQQHSRRYEHPVVYVAAHVSCQRAVACPDYNGVDSKDRREHHNSELYDRLQVFEYVSVVAGKAAILNWKG